MISEGYFPGENMRNHHSLISIQVVIILTLLAIPSIALADSIIFKSDLNNEGNNITGNNVQISYLYPTTGGDPQTGWQSNGSDYFWVSYADTGNPPVLNNNINYSIWPADVTDPITLGNPAQPTAVFYETFSLPYDFNTGFVTIWADDTARVYINKKNNTGSYDQWALLTDANPVNGDYCANGSIGCIPANFGLFNLSELHLEAGDYQLQLDAYQRRGGPFGVLYTGSINSQSVPDVPEPSSLLLLATGAATLCFIARRRS
jgi:hypothetical protein